MPLNQAQSPLPIQNNGVNLPQTYRAALNVVGTAGIAVEIRGSGSAIVFITKIGLTLAASDTISIVKRSANSTGGTSSPATLVPLDSNNAAANATILEYTAAPTPGTAVGGISTFTGTEVSYDFGDSNNKQPLTLRAAVEAVSIALTTGTTITGFIEWSEI